MIMPCHCMYRQQETSGIPVLYIFRFLFWWRGQNRTQVMCAQDVLPLLEYVP